jgi:hypothetical protein
MFVFIIPLKSSKVSKSWERTSYLLERTLRSICGQTCNDYRIIIVCNEKPITQFDSPFVEYIQADLPPPKNDWWEKDFDKAKKLMIGAEFSKQYDPSYLMVVDSDDLVSNKIVAFVKNEPDQAGWFLNQGYIHEFNSRTLYYLRKDFGKYCGSCIIIKPSLFESLFKDNIYDHTNPVLALHGIILTNLPFCGGVYSRGNGDNIFAQESFFTHNLLPKGNFIALFKHLIRFRPITNKIKKEFGFY